MQGFDDFIPSKEEYLTWLKKWVKADYSLSVEKDAQGNYQTISNQDLLNAILHGNMLGRDFTFNFPIQIFGETKNYWIFHIPPFDDELKKLPNPFGHDAPIFPDYWEQGIRQKFITFQTNFKNNIDRILEHLFSNQRLLAGVSLLKDHQLQHFNKGRVDLSNVIIPGHLSVLASNITSLRIKDSLVNRIIFQKKNTDFENLSIEESIIYSEFNGGNIHGKTALISNTKFYTNSNINAQSIELINTMFNEGASIHATRANCSDIEFSNATLSSEHITLSRIRASELTLHSKDNGQILIDQNSRIDSLSVTGNANVSIKLTYTHIETYLKIDNTIANRLHIENTVCNGLVDISNSTFGDVKIDASKFHKVFFAQNTIVTTGMLATKTTFDDDLNISMSSSLSENTSRGFPNFEISNSIIRGQSDLTNRSFNARTSFFKTKFKTPPYFHSSQLH